MGNAFQHRGAINEKLFRTSSEAVENEVSRVPRNFFPLTAYATAEHLFSKIDGICYENHKNSYRENYSLLNANLTTPYLFFSIVAEFIFKV